MKIQQEIRRIRTAKGMNRRELARRSGISYYTLVFWDDGNGNPSLNDCIRIARALGITLEELTAGVTRPEDEERI